MLTSEIADEGPPIFRPISPQTHSCSSPDLFQSVDLHFSKLQRTFSFLFYLSNARLSDDYSQQYTRTKKQAWRICARTQERDVKKHHELRNILHINTRMEMNQSQSFVFSLITRTDLIGLFLKSSNTTGYRVVFFFFKITRPLLQEPLEFLYPTANRRSRVSSFEEYTLE